MILPALQGLSEGFSKTFGDIQTQKRKNDYESSKLIAESLKQRADSDPTLTPDEHDNLYRQYYKTLHPELKPKDLETLIGTHQYIRGQLAQNIPPMPQAPQNQPTGMNDIPDSSGGLPPMPQAPMTMGQGRYQEAHDRTLQGEQEKANAVRQAEKQSREDLAQFNEQQIQRIQGRTDITDDQKDQLLQPYGVKALRKGGTGAATFVKGTIDSEGLQYRLRQEGKTQEADAIPPGKFWSVAMDPSKTHTVSYTPTIANTYQGKEATGANFISQFPKDYFGEAVDPHGLYYPVLNRAGGSVIGILPHALLDTETTANNFLVVPMKDGGSAVVPKTTTTTTHKTPVGPAGASVAPPMPTPPGESPAPQTDANGKPVPGQPLPKPQGKTATPSTDLPKPPGSGGVKGKNGSSIGAASEIAGAGKSFTPDQELNWRAFYTNSRTTENRIQQLINDKDVFNSLPSAAKVEFATSPDKKEQILSRWTNMTPAQIRVAKNIISLREDINTIRRLYQATGFRGPDAFNAMTALGGSNVLVHPEVMTGVLAQTQESLKNQAGLIANALKEHNLEPQEYVRPKESYKEYARLNGKVIGSDDGDKWFDAETGKPVK